MVDKKQKRTKNKTKQNKKTTPYLELWYVSKYVKQNAVLYM